MELTNTMTAMLERAIWMPLLLAGPTVVGIPAGIITRPSHPHFVPLVVVVVAVLPLAWLARQPRSARGHVGWRDDEEEDEEDEEDMSSISADLSGSETTDEE